MRPLWCLFVTRNPIKCFLLCILLVVSALAVSISGELLLNVNAATRVLASEYTTVAAISEMKLGIKENSTENFDNVFAAAKNAREISATSPYVSIIDDKHSLSAYSEDIISCIPVEDYGDTSWAATPYTRSVIVGKCLSVNFVSDDPQNRSYEAVFSIDHENSPVLHPDFYNVELFNYINEIFFEGPRIPFEKDKTYIFYCDNVGSLSYGLEDHESVLNFGEISYIIPFTEGFRSSSPMTTEEMYIEFVSQGYLCSKINQTKVMSFEHVSFNNPYKTAGAKQLFADKILENVTIKSAEVSSDNADTAQYHEDLPVWNDDAVKYTDFAEFGEGGVEALLNSEAGGLWEKWIKLAKISQSSVNIYRTNCLDAVISFNQKNAVVTRGRAFSDEEYEGGVRVCLISEQLAQKNDLYPGDILTLNLYNNGYDIYVGHGNYEPAPVSYLITDGETDDKVAFEIVGIYRTTGQSRTNHFSFSENTLFIPDKSLEKEYPAEALKTYTDYQTGEEKTIWDGRYFPERFGMYSLVLKNGSVKAFENDMKANGAGDAFLYFDQGYSKIDEPLSAFKNSALLWLFVACAMWIISLIMFYVLTSGIQRRNAGILRSLGFTQRKLRRHLFAIAVSFGTISSILAVSIGSLAFKTIQTSALSSALVGIDIGTAINQNSALPIGLLNVIAIQLAIFVVSAFVWASVLSKRDCLNLMKGLRNK